MPRSTQLGIKKGGIAPFNYYTLAVSATTMIIPVPTPMVLQGLYCPSNLTGTTVTLVESSPDGGVTWHPVYSSGNLAATTAAELFSFYVAASRLVRFSPADFYGMSLIRLTFNTAQLVSDAVFQTITGVVTGD
jgi:hypothetical protein